MDQNLGRVSSYNSYICVTFPCLDKIISVQYQKLADSHGFVNFKCFTLVGGVVIIDSLLTVSLVLKKLQTLGEKYITTDSFSQDYTLPE